MATRGVIARPAGNGWEGRYHHWDSYPSGLGKTLWDAYHRFFRRDIDAMTSYLIDQHPAGWSTIVGADLTLPPGFTEHGNSRFGDYSKGLITWEEYRNLPQNRRPQCYCHGDRNEPEQLITHDQDPVDLEWAYVLSPTSMTVLISVPTTWDDPALNGRTPTEFDIKWNLRPLKWVVAGVVDWDGPEPAWETLVRAEVEHTW